MGALTTMTSKGQLTIPKDVRDQLNLAPGTRFYVTVRNGQIVAIPKNKRIADFAGILGKPPHDAGIAVEDIDEAIMDAAAEDDARITREWHEGRK